MKKHFVIWALVALVFVATGESRAQTNAPATGGTNQSSTQNRVVGEVTAIDAAARQLTVKTDDGKSVLVSTGDRTAVLRLPPGEATAEKAVKITLADINAGDRMFARGEMAADGNSLTARQVVVTNSKGAAQAADRDREEWRRRGINGRITALNPQTKEITLATRSRDGAGSITLAAGGNVRFLRNAPDSSKLSDATQSSFADLKVGDQVRARGETSADGTRFVPEEIVSGSILRAGGTVTAINVASNELTIKNSQTGQTLTVAIGGKSSLRRIPPDVAATLAQRRVQGGAARNGSANNGPAGAPPAQGAERSPANGANQRAGADRERGEGRRGERGGVGGGGGRNFQEMMESLPAITLADLKKGDAVFVIGTPGNNASRATAITLITGDAEFLNRLQQFQGRPNRDGRNTSPGLPGDVLGGGAANRDQPPTQPR
ncbi:MAG TPA: hypothetical protein VGO91_11050 [Pyrinomonadaceae bacterium]|nr:hypothetical protein [Pyrinomonadaceae bacterium]